MKWVPAIVVVGYGLLPTLTWATVSISEIAWMGSASNANHEWIELHNSSASALDVTGWTLTDGVNLTIALDAAATPVIPAGAHVTLKRTSEASAPGPTFLIYMGALVNTGATLTLRRADGTIVDQVVGGADWQNVGGDNATKDTAQYTPQGWITALPTPGAPNASVPSTPDSASPAATTTNPTAASATNAAPRRLESSGGEPVRLVLPDVSLQLTITGQSIGYVNQLIDFSVTPSGLGETWLRSLGYTWNFGDGFGTASGTEASYRFAFPGTYVVTVHGAYGRHEQATRHEITILPASLSLTTDSHGHVLVHNDAPYEVDISGFRLVGANSTHTFPPRTIMLPYQTLTVPRTQLGNVSTQLIGLYDTARTMVASSLPSTSVFFAPSLPGEIYAVHATPVTGATQVATSGMTRPPTSAASAVTLPVQPEPEPLVAGVVTAPVATMATTTSVVAAPVSASPPPRSTVPPEAWLALLVALGCGALVVRPRSVPSGAAAAQSSPATVTTNPFL